MFQEYMKRAEECLERARAYLDKGEVDLAIFYRNAANGYKQKALEVKICQA